MVSALAEVSIVPEIQAGASAGIRRRRGGTRGRAGKAARARARLADTAKADRPGIFPRAATVASAAAGLEAVGGDFMAAAVAADFTVAVEAEHAEVAGADNAVLVMMS